MSDFKFAFKSALIQYKQVSVKKLLTFRPNMFSITGF
jgi:hypothetical protein